MDKDGIVIATMVAGCLGGSILLGLHYAEEANENQTTIEKAEVSAEKVATTDREGARVISSEVSDPYAKGTYVVEVKLDYNGRLVTCSVEGTQVACDDV